MVPLAKVEFPNSVCAGPPTSHMMPNLKLPIPFFIDVTLREVTTTLIFSCVGDKTPQNIDAPMFFLSPPSCDKGRQPQPNHLDKALLTI